MPEGALPNLLLTRDQEAERRIRDYVEWQAKDEKVSHAERVSTEFVLGRRLDAWDVRTDKGRWWVITSPTNLYSHELFPSLDYTLSFHVGVTTRMMSQPELWGSRAREVAPSDGLEKVGASGGGPQRSRRGGRLPSGRDEVP